MGKLDGQSVIITGASAGIGAATARVLAAEGANLVLTARRRDRIEELQGELGGRVAIVDGDVRDEETARRCVQTAVDQFGRLDILVNNAGIAKYKGLVEFSAEEYDEMMDVNMRSTFLFARHAVPVMVDQGAGNIVIVSSVAGRYGFANEAIYCATKFAQVGFAQALDNELRIRGVKVTLICPGGVKTELAIGNGRTEAGVAASGMLEPEDVAQAILLACSQPAHSRILEIRMRPMVEALS